MSEDYDEDMEKITKHRRVGSASAYSNVLTNFCSAIVRTFFING